MTRSRNRLGLRLDRVPAPAGQALPARALDRRAASGVRRPCAELGENSRFGELETHPSHFLIALWRPLDIATPFLPRMAVQGLDRHAGRRHGRARAAGSRLPPAPAPLRRRSPEIDWALVARRPDPRASRGLEAVPASRAAGLHPPERRATLAAISVQYNSRDETFEQFATTVFAGLGVALARRRRRLPRSRFQIPTFDSDEALRGALRRARRQHRDARQGRRAEALLRRRRAARRRLGGVFPGRRQAAPGGAEPACCARSPAAAPASTTGCSTPATRRSATSPRRSRTCCRRRAHERPRPRRRGSRSACCRCAGWRPRSRPRASRRTGTSSTRPAASCSTS